VRRLTAVDTAQLIQEIATRAAPARVLAERYGAAVAELRAFTEAHREAIESAAEAAKRAEETAEPTPGQLDGLWITNKYERLRRYQDVAAGAYDRLTFGTDDMPSAEYATVLREFRSYLMLAANELGQLLHRGAGDSGDGDVLSVDIQGIDMDSLR
jgi:hypothetical protein